MNSTGNNTYIKEYIGLRERGEKTPCSIHYSPFTIFLHSLCLILALLVSSNGFAAQTCNTAIPASTPTSRFVDHGNGTVTDTKTGLMWKQCTEGLSGAGCATGTAATYTWQGALQAAQTLNTNGGFAGFTDWRVPNVKELQSIVEFQCATPTINATIFPATVVGWYWTASRDVNSNFTVWTITFGYGYSTSNNRLFNYYVRLVRGGQ